MPFQAFRRIFTDKKYEFLSKINSAPIYWDVKSWVIHSTVHVHNKINIRQSAAKTRVKEHIWFGSNDHFAYYCIKMYVVGTQLNCLTNAILMSTHNIDFNEELRKITLKS